MKTKGCNFLIRSKQTGKYFRKIGNMASCDVDLNSPLDLFNQVFVFRNPEEVIQFMKQTNQAHSKDIEIIPFRLEMGDPLIVVDSEVVPPSEAIVKHEN